MYDMYDLYDLAHAAGWDPYNPHHLQHMLPRLGSVPYADLAQPLTTAGEELDPLQ